MVHLTSLSEKNVGQPVVSGVGQIIKKLKKK